MRRFVSSRWLGLHAAMVIIVAGFLAMGWWQLRRAEGGNALSWGYTFEWPLFAGFVVVFWVKAMRDELREARGDAPGSAGAVAPVALPTRIRAGDRQGPDQAEEQEDDELAAYNAYLARLNAVASGPGSWLTRRGARRHAIGWAARPTGPGQAGGPGPAGGAGGQPRPGSPPQMEA